MSPLDIEQKVVRVSKHDCGYYYFFGSSITDSLEWHIKQGWIAKHIQDDQVNQSATVLFERTRDRYTPPATP